MACPIENVKDINDFKYLWKIVVKIRNMWFITSMSNKEHLETVIIDAKIYVLYHS